MTDLKRKAVPALVLALALTLAGCTRPGSVSSPFCSDNIYIDQVELGDVIILDEAVPLSEAPAAGLTDRMLLPEASGRLTRSNSKAAIDYSNTADGYVMVRFTAATAKRLRVRVAGPGTVYTYELPAGAWTSFPLTDGDGAYKITVYENTRGSKYATVLAAEFNAALRDEFAPFLLPNQYVDYAQAPDTLALAAELTRGLDDPLSKVESVYRYVVHELSYDTEKAAAVQSGYLPVLDDVLAAKKGICFDYAALMAGMLRSQGVPCKLITGYVPVGDGQLGYHAWISVWSEEAGWVEGVVYFDGRAWQRMDPTFASSSNGSARIMQFIGDGSNYTVKYIY